jgi:hypothetical protein
MTRKRTSENDLVVSGTGAAAPARRKAAARPRAKRAAEPLETLAPVATGQEDAAALTLTYTPNYDDIAKLAYSYWEARGFQGGCPEEDWLRAETELRNSSASVAVV